jgi:hypothetical protein
MRTSSHKTDERWFGDATEPDRLACASRPWNTLAGALAYGPVPGARAFHGRDRPAPSATVTPGSAFTACEDFAGTGTRSLSDGQASEHAMEASPAIPPPMVDSLVHLP